MPVLDCNWKWYWHFIALLFRPPRTVVPRALCFTRDLFYFFLIRQWISELRRPIAATLCHVINISVDFTKQVQKFGGPSVKNFGGQNMQKFRPILHNFRLWSRISPERLKISEIGKTCDRERFLPRSEKQVRWTVVHYPWSRTCPQTRSWGHTGSTRVSGICWMYIFCLRTSQQWC